MFKSIGKKVVSSSVIASMLLVPVSSVFAESGFTDIDNSYAKSEIEELESRGIFNGEGGGRFNPTGAISRQDFALVLARALSLDMSAPSPVSSFSDVSTSSYAYAAIDALERAGLISGIGNGKFGMGSSLTREQMVVLFVRALGVDPSGQAERLTFNDTDTISVWARDSIGYAISVGLIQGTGNGRFNPKGIVDRQQLAIMASYFVAMEFNASNPPTSPDTSNPIPNTSNPINVPTPPATPVPIIPVNQNEIPVSNPGNNNTTPSFSSLTSIQAPAPITGVANGTSKTPEALGLPGTVAILTSTGTRSATVIWDVAESTYMPSRTDAQTFTVKGSVTLPSGVSNPNNVKLITQVSVSVAAYVSLSSISPAKGATTGGTTVILTGAQLSGTTGITIGGVPVTSFTVDSATQITAVTPAGTAGSADVVVTTAGGSATLSNGFTYVAAPTLSNLTPSTGTEAGGTSVTLSGTNFTGATSVTFGGVAATSFVVNSDTSITAVTPAGTAGSVDVVVTTSGGSATLSNGFTYVSGP